MKLMFKLQLSLCHFQVKLDERVMTTERGLLFHHLFKQDEGVYICRTREHGFTQILARFTLEVLQGDLVNELMARDRAGFSDGLKDRSAGSYRSWMPCSTYSRSGSASQIGQSRTWFKDIMQLIGPSNLPHVEEYCERMWCNDKLKRKHKGMLEKYRQAQESARKARSKSSGERNRTPRDLRGREEWWRGGQRGGPVQVFCCVVHSDAGANSEVWVRRGHWPPQWP